MRFFRIRMLTLFSIISIQIFFAVKQYVYYTPTWNNQYLEASFFEGFLNGVFIFINVLLYWFSDTFSWDSQFYFFDYLNPNPEYLSGFVAGIGFFVLIKFLVEICKPSTKLI